MPSKAILFDLDGTLTDNRVGITGGCMAAQKAMGLPVSLPTTGPITKSRAFLKMYLTPVFIPF